MPFNRNYTYCVNIKEPNKPEPTISNEVLEQYRLDIKKYEKRNRMQRVGRFEKVSFEQFKKDFLKYHNRFEDEIYDNVKIPIRMTSGSAGYDFVSPLSFQLEPGDTISFPTGIKCFIEPGWFLGIFPRSSLGLRYRLQLDNCIGIIDEDFYGNTINEGDILMQLTNDSKDEKIVHVETGNRIAQGIFIPYGITYDDNVDGIRTGGIGSTNNE